MRDRVEAALNGLLAEAGVRPADVRAAVEAAAGGRPALVTASFVVVGRTVVRHGLKLEPERRVA